MSELDLNFATGFYMAVNIGYSIGFGDIPETGELGSQWFSTVYVLIGASFVGAALGIFAEHIVADKDHWYEKEKEELEYQEKIKDSSRLVKIIHFLVFHQCEFQPIVLWILFVSVATLAAWNTNEEFNFINSLYFAVSSLSTGGHYSLPGGNREWVYGLTGLYCAFGVPLMGVAMATIASFFINVGSIEDTLQDMKKPISKQEVDMLTEFGLADDDGEIDKSEFIILCMVRTGAVSPGLVKLMELYFNELDDDKSGKLSVDEILKNRSGASSAADKLMQDVKKGLAKGASDIFKSSRNLVGTLNSKTASFKKGISKDNSKKGRTPYSSVAMTSMNGDEVSGSNPMKIVGRDENYV